MKVYFGENFWGCEREQEDKEPGEALWLEEQFEWLGRQWRIPAVYVCKEGLVADVCILVPAEEIERFLKKWEPRMAGLSDEEWEDVHAENPMDEEFYMELYINGRKSEGWTGCGTCWYPPRLLSGEEAGSAPEREGLRNGSVEERLLEAYGCSRESGWRFCRQSWPWPDGVREPVRTLDFIFKKAPVSYRGPHFRTVPGEKTTAEFVHPVSGIRHTLTVREQIRSELSAEHLSVLKQGRTGNRRFPSHFLSMRYTVDPELPEMELQVEDCAGSDPPAVVGREESKRASSVSIIGGASGPTAIFLAGKRTWEDAPLRHACSALHYEPVNAVEWRIRLRVDGHEKRELNVVF